MRSATTQIFVIVFCVGKWNYFLNKYQWWFLLGPNSEKAADDGWVTLHPWEEIGEDAERNQGHLPPGGREVTGQGWGEWGETRVDMVCGNKGCIWSSWEIRTTFCRPQMITTQWLQSVHSDMRRKLEGLEHGLHKFGYWFLQQYEVAFQG